MLMLIFGIIMILGCGFIIDKMELIITGCMGLSIGFVLFCFGIATMMGM